ncbi:hypothetical protein, partial [Lactobacillus helveticus]|uniref:hypothetical protein n=1 Tax=Lactobacillus helveticus TaxID=1587 RepID=UPI001E4CB542
LSTRQDGVLRYFSLGRLRYIKKLMVLKPKILIILSNYYTIYAFYMKSQNIKIMSVVFITV